MSQYGPGEAPPVVRRRARRVRRAARQQPSSTARQNAAFGSRPARPLPKPKPAPAPRVVRAGGDTKSDVHAGEDFKQTQAYRGAVVGAYDGLSRHEKRQRVSQAASRVKNGTASEADHAILHIHRSRVAGTKKITRINRAFEALDPASTKVRRGAAAPAPSGLRLEPGRTKPGKPVEKGSILTAIKGLGKAVTAISRASSKGYESVGAPKILVNAPKDIGDLVVTTPSSLAKLGSDVVHHPQKVPGELVAPYKQLAKDPKKFVTEHPASTLLMVAPTVRAPGRIVGKGARLLGKQTLERPAATFEGTNLRETRTGSRDYVVRRRQARQDAKQGAPQMTEGQVNKRVDEFYDVARADRERQVHAITRDNPDADVSKAYKVARKTVRRRFAAEFGGETFATKEAAAEAASSLPFEPKVMRVKGGYTNVPKFAADRLRHHESVGTAKATGARVLRTSRRAFTKTVLPLSPKWLTGQAAEAALRSLVAGAGPVSYVRGARALRALDETTRRDVMARVGGQSAVPRQILEERGGRTAADEFAGTSLAKVANAATALGKAPVVRNVVQANDAVSTFVFNTLNGKIIEGTAHRAMLGRALKDSPLMDHRMVGLSNRAIEDAAQGLKNTEAQVHLAREVRKMYGVYSSFSPEKRELVLHWTPFLPYLQNMGRFIAWTVPKEHPVAAAALADIDAAEEEWRKRHGLSFHGKGRQPGWKMGSYPVDKAGERVVRVARYLPFVPGDAGVKTIVDLILPQFSGALAAAGGRDPVSDEPVHGKFGPAASEPEKAIAAAIQLVESMVPGVGVAHRVHDRGPNAVFNPVAPTRAPKVKRKGAGAAGPAVKLPLVNVKPVQVKNPLLKLP